MDYTQKQLNKVLPEGTKTNMIDIKIMTMHGETKWLSLNTKEQKILIDKLVDTHQTTTDRLPF